MSELRERLEKRLVWWRNDLVYAAPETVRHAVGLRMVGELEQILKGGGNEKREVAPCPGSATTSVVSPD